MAAMAAKWPPMAAMAASNGRQMAASNGRQMATLAVLQCSLQLFLPLGKKQLLL